MCFRPGRLQIRIIVLCRLVSLLEGFDLQAIGVVAPAMAGSLHIGPNQFGAIFSAAVFGLMLDGFGLDALRAIGQLHKASHSRVGL